jgi:hypothetical protein
MQKSGIQSTFEFIQPFAANHVGSTLNSIAIDQLHTISFNPVLSHGNYSTHKPLQVTVPVQWQVSKMALASVNCDFSLC